MHENTKGPMPYFIRPSKNLGKSDKLAAYQAIETALQGILTGETDSVLKMATINCLLKTHLPYGYWVGFYIVKNGALSVGPYQGTLGCLRIPFGKGVCGAVAVSRQTKIVTDVNLLVEGEDHITCDPHSQSEIVVPVFDASGELMAVLDMDSTLKGSFDEVDGECLERIMERCFGFALND